MKENFTVHFIVGKTKMNDKKEVYYRDSANMVEEYVLEDLKGFISIEKYALLERKKKGDSNSQLV